MTVPVALVTVLAVLVVHLQYVIADCKWCLAQPGSGSKLSALKHTQTSPSALLYNCQQRAYFVSSLLAHQQFFPFSIPPKNPSPHFRNVCICCKSVPFIYWFLNTSHEILRGFHCLFCGPGRWRGTVGESGTSCWCCFCLQRGNSALHVAALAGHIEVVRLLLQNSACVNLRSEVGGTKEFKKSLWNSLVGLGTSATCYNTSILCSTRPCVSTCIL